ncbi:hypothetical protein Trichorick_01047 [Candidatus Trichorickettsia mobilis]|uniref:Uncharacterized protein n=1 Tax=Candidatus Trichorickettsia mobilis TaxID=1346319 RepID=A0ABZ0USZ1_9RICK|nr:hypothetical protein Trichorick_01047 [Candidatus Trichorickettsia mobilis]
MTKSDSIRHLLQTRTKGTQALEAFSASTHSVHKVSEDSSLGITSQLSTRVEFVKRFIILRILNLLYNLEMVEEFFRQKRSRVPQAVSCLLRNGDEF